jgi:23S rRNA (guanosine2251-2'-O)-methyltransferase
MRPTQLLLGFHAVGARLRVAPASVVELLVDAARRDRRMQHLRARAQAAGAVVHEVDAARLDALAGGNLRHQGVVARAAALERVHSLDDLLDGLNEPPLLLLLDGVTDPHNLGACLRAADGAGVHAVVAPKDRACGLSATVHKVACGAAEHMPYLMVTNLARTLGELQERGVQCVGAADEAPRSLYDAQLEGPLAFVLGAEGEGLRRLTRERCDQLVSIPMLGSVESLNVAVASALCLYEARRQRGWSTAAAG